MFIYPTMSEKQEKEFYCNYNRHVQDRGVTFDNSLEEFHLKSKVIAKERFEVIKTFFYQKKVLEIGSSTGAFLSLLDTCNTNACELSYDNLSYSKQFLSGSAYRSIDDITEGNFDIICMFHVFEHISKPIGFLNKCKSLLNKNGRIIIEVPCSDDPLITLYQSKEFKDFVFQPMHPMIYNEKSLDYVFKKAGLSKDIVIYHQRYGLSNHLSWLKNKKPGGDVNLDMMFGNNTEYKKRLEDLKKTDTIFYFSKLD